MPKINTKTLAKINALCGERDYCVRDAKLFAEYSEIKVIVPPLRYSSFGGDNDPRAHLTTTKEQPLNRLIAAALAKHYAEHLAAIDSSLAALGYEPEEGEEDAA